MSSFTLSIIPSVRRRRAQRLTIARLVDQAVERSEQLRHEAHEVMAAITTRTDQNHIAEGITEAFAQRRRLDDSR